MDRLVNPRQQLLSKLVHNAFKMAVMHDDSRVDVFFFAVIFSNLINSEVLKVLTFSLF